MLLHLLIFNMLSIGNNCRYFLYKVFRESRLSLLGKSESKPPAFTDTTEGLKSSLVPRPFRVFVAKGCRRPSIPFSIFDFLLAVSLFSKLHILAMGLNTGPVSSKCSLLSGLLPGLQLVFTLALRAVLFKGNFFPISLSCLSGFFGIPRSMWRLLGVECRELSSCKRHDNVSMVDLSLCAVSNMLTADLDVKLPLYE